LVFDICRLGLAARRSIAALTVASMSELLAIAGLETGHAHRVALRFLANSLTKNNRTNDCSD
jgi:hypothetical protein